MSEKRFKSTLDEDTMSIMPYLVSDNEEECFYNLEQIVELLNELNKENQRLKNDCSILVQSNQEYRKENDDLRFALRTEQAFTRVKKDKKPFLSKEEFFKELEEDE